MTYEEKVHHFGLRWLMNNSASVARLREFDTSRLITLEEEATGWGCSCDYDYSIERWLVVPHVNGGTFKVQIDEHIHFADLLKGIIDAEPVELSGVADMVMAGQADQIAALKAELAESRKEKANADGQLRTLKNGLAQQENLWTYLRNLYKDLQDYTDGSTGLAPEELDELIAFLYRELDLWFNVDQMPAELDGKVTFAVRTNRQIGVK
jgi:hypothetical protein